MVDSITAPILDGTCDFVKSNYGRKSGRVTELLAKPLLAELFPSLVSFNQPLSGVIAGRKAFFKLVRFENDYGVDVGILIDMVNNGARIKEVNVGYIDHKMKPWRKLVGMSGEVARSIIKRAKLTNRAVQEGILAEACVLSDLMAKGVGIALPIEKIAFLDMDGTLIKKRFIFEFSKARNFASELEKISLSSMESYAKTNMIASLLKGASNNEIMAQARRMELSPGAANLVRKLKKAGYSTVILTDSYESVALNIAERVGAGMVIANRLAHDNGICTGDVTINPLFFPFGPSCARHAICKLNVAMRFCSAHDVRFENTLAVGDSENDACLLRFANKSFAYRPASQLVARASKAVVDDLRDIPV
jgi:HAD superfamily phosphoserine phosphatase-like hydrolase